MLMPHNHGQRTNFSRELTFCSHRTIDNNTDDA
jgi:hypothetical protein